MLRDSVTEDSETLVSNEMKKLIQLLTAYSNYIINAIDYNI